MEWQMICEDQWVFGEKVRGLVRAVRAEVWYCPFGADREHEWMWTAYSTAAGEAVEDGRAESRGAAVHAAEEALGIKED